MTLVLDAIRALNRAIISGILAIIYVALFGIARLLLGKRARGWQQPEAPTLDSFSSPY